MPPDICAAHDLLISNFDHLRENQSQLYNLNRAASERTAAMATTLARLEDSTAAGFAAVGIRQDAFDKTLTASLKRLEALIVEHRPRRWTPAQKVAMVSAILGPGGIAVYAAFFKG